LTTEDTEGTEKKQLLVQLVAGLVASGHYTVPYDQFSAAVKAGVIHHLCYRKAKRAQAHARVLAVYRGAV
jgi:hypothetical protein